MSNPLVSVIIPNYNYARYLREAIDSVLGQTYKAIEIIVVDDGSKDESLAILDSYGSPITVIRQQNQGVSNARNNGVKASVGKYTAFLDADDLWLPDKVEKQVQRFLADPAVALVHVGVEEINAEGERIGIRMSGLDGDVAGEMLRLRRDVILGGGSGLMVRRDLFDQIGGFDPQLSTSADWDVCFQLACRGPVAFVPEILVNYRMHSSNMHGNVDLMERDMGLAFAKAFDRAAPPIAALKRAAYAGLHQNLAGSYYRAGNYPKFLEHSVKSLFGDPRNISYFLKGRSARQADRH